MLKKSAFAVQSLPKSIHIPRFSSIRMSSSSASATSKLVYPVSRQDESSFKTYSDGEVKLADPWAWLENPDSEEVKEWVDKQNALTDSVIQSFPHRQTILKRLTDAYNYERRGTVFRKGSNYYYYRNSGLENQSILYKLTGSLSAEPVVFLNPNTLSADGTASIGTSAFSEDGSHFAYGVSLSGSDWQTIRIKNVASGKDELEDKIEWVKFSGIAWTHDNLGFFYSRYPVPASLQSQVGEMAEDKKGSETDANKNHMLYYHRLGTNQSEDILIYADPTNPKWLFSPRVSDDGSLLLLSISESTAPVNRLYIAPIASILSSAEPSLSSFVKLIDNFDAGYDYITNDGSRLVFQTNDNAPRYKVIAIDTQHPERENWQELVPESAEGDVLNSTFCADNDVLVCEYMHNVQSVLRMYSIVDGSYKGDLPLPAIGTVAELSARRKFSELFYKFTSFVHAGTSLRYDFTTGQLETIFESQISGIEVSDFKTEQVWYTSKDGTKVPMFIVSPKNSAPGPLPCFLYGYGGFSISLQPSFSPLRLAFLKSFGAIFALPNLRGGGEFGEAWHEAGTLGRKQNVFDDFQCAAEHLIETKRTTADKIAINGGSNGGLLVSACINQRPDLFGCGVSAVGVQDMLNFHRYTIGYAWSSDYGCADKKEDFEFLYKYSPIHNVKARADTPYPAVLITTSDHDDRVVPLHSYKYAAQLQQTIIHDNKNGDGSNCQPDAKPLLLRVEVKAGHGAGKPTAKVLEEYADVYSFIGKTLNLEFIE